MTIKMRWLDWVLRDSAAPLPEMPWTRTVRAGADRRAAAADASAKHPVAPPRAA